MVEDVHSGQAVNGVATCMLPSRNVELSARSLLPRAAAC
jgi:hypothetical protein